MGVAKNARLDAWLVDAIDTASINHYLGTAYTIEQIQDWPEYQIAELLALIDALKPKRDGKHD